MASYDQWLASTGSKAPSYLDSLKGMGVNTDYLSLGNTPTNPLVTQNQAFTQQNPGAPAWSGIPQVGFPTAGNGPVPTSFWDGLLGKKNADGSQDLGWGGMALGAAQGLAGAYMGMKNYGLAKDSLEQGKKQFQMNYDAQKQTTNTALEDRQRARVANNPNSVAVNEYMNQNRIK